MSPIAGLSQQRQDDFAVGMQTDVARHLIDARGSLLIRNGLLDDDGSIYLRGGSKAKSNRRFGTGLRGIWDGQMLPGQRTFFYSNEDYGVLDADDATPVNLGGSGRALPAPARFLHNLLFLPNGDLYGGSRKAADYSTSTVALTNGSASVVGTGTSWTANVDAGMIFRHGSGERVYVVQQVVDNTHLTLADAYEGSTASGQAYTLKRLETASSPYPSALIYGIAGQRLLYAKSDSVVAWSARQKPHSLTATDNWELGDGLKILGIEGLGNDAIIFTTQGYRIIRNIVLDLTDALGALQQRLDTPNKDLVLWGPAGVANYRGALVVPAMDGIHLVDTTSNPVPIHAGIQERYFEYLSLGHRPGGATVFDNHYLLPVLTATGDWVDTLVCRLDRPAKSRSRTYWPWTVGDGAGMKCSAFAVRPATDSGAGPYLLGAERRESNEILLDDFAVDTISNGVWKYIYGTGLQVTGGHLIGHSGTPAVITRSVDKPEADFGGTVKLHIDNSGTPITVFFGKSIAGVVLSGYVTIGDVSPTFGVYRTSVSSSMLLFQAPSVVPPANSDVWLRVRFEGDLVTVEVWTTDPALGGSPGSSTSYTLTGSDAATFGAGVSGDVGIGFLSASSTGNYVDEARMLRLGARVLDCSRFFDPDEDVKYDHDGSIRDFEWVTRAYATGDGNSLNRVRRARLLYEMFNAVGDLPHLQLSISPGRTDSGNLPLWDEVNWDEFDWAESDDATWLLLDGFALPDDGRNGHDWLTGERMRYATFRLRSSGPIARLAIRSFEVFTAVGGRNRQTRVES